MGISYFLIFGTYKIYHLIFRNELGYFIDPLVIEPWSGADVVDSDVMISTSRYKSRKNKNSVAEANAALKAAITLRKKGNWRKVN